MSDLPTRMAIHPIALVDVSRESHLMTIERFDRSESVIRRKEQDEGDALVQPRLPILDNRDSKPTVLRQAALECHVLHDFPVLAKQLMDVVVGQMKRNIRQINRRLTRSYFHRRICAH